MKQFFKFFFASLLGSFVTFLIIVFIGIIIFSGIAMSSKKSVDVKENSVLKIKLDKPIYDRAPKSPVFVNPMSFSPEKAIGLDMLEKNLKKAAVDPNIKGIYLNVMDVMTGYSFVDEIRQMFKEFKESGKFIIAYSEVYSQKAYYLASVADKVYINPKGMMMFKGLNAEIMFFKGALEKLDVEVQIIRPDNNKFKSAVEPFFRKDMSEANRIQYSRLFNSLWNEVLENISASREISKEKLNDIADNLLANSPENTKELGLTDGTIYYDELLAELKALCDTTENAELEMISLGEYSDVDVKEYSQPYSRDKIAILYANGDIVSGKGDDYTIGSLSQAKAIQKIRKDKSVKALVLRVNSPGGDALASETILRELELTMKEKPVVASFGNYAASGGYYISCKSDWIISGPNTLTGSIGVWGILPNMEGFLNGKLGLSFDNVKTNKNAGFPSVNRALTDDEAEYLKHMVHNTYMTFKENVAQGRDMTVEYVDSIGQGRVWTGLDALEIGLVDEIGGMKEAIAKAAELAELDEYRIVKYPAQKEPLEQIMEELKGNTSLAIQEELGPFYEYYKIIQNLQNKNGVQARMPMVFNVN